MESPDGANRRQSIHIEKREDGRSWAVYEGEELIAVTLFRKGANRIKQRIEELRAMIERSEHEAK